MVYLKKIIKQDLLRLFEEGKSENEAFDELSKAHSSNPVSLKVISNWFTIFRSGENTISDKKRTGRPAKFTDDFLINLVKNNPELNMAELAKLANTSQYTISNRLKQINTSGKGVSYIKKGTHNGPKKLTDEFLINLVNENPALNMREISDLTGFALSTISRRFNKINTSEQKACYIDKSFKNGAKRFTDEYLINLINENPELNMEELAKLANTCTSNISTRLKKINSNRSDDDKIVLKKKTNKTERKSRKTISNDSLIKLVNENPELSAYELAKLADVSAQTIYTKLKQLNADDSKANYIKKSKKNGTTKFTDEFLINLINENPEYNMEELAKLTNTTQGTISSRLKQINIDGNNVGYVKKGTHNGPIKFTNEHLINLVNDNPELNMTELAKLTNKSQSFISVRLRQIDTSGKDANYIKKGTHNGTTKLTDELLIDLINENPDLNMKQLAKLANTTASTISIRLKKINSNGERVKYVKKR